MTTTRSAGEILFNNGTPYKLVSPADTVGDVEYWWCETTFVEHPETKMVPFNKHFVYNGLHTNRSHPAKTLV